MAFDLLRVDKLIRLILWPWAISVFVAELEVLSAYVPLAAAFAEITGALALAAYVAAKVLLGWLLIFLFAGLLPYVLWGAEPELPSFVAAVVSAAYFSLGQWSVSFISFFGLTPLAVVILGHVWIRGKDGRSRKWFFVVSPLSAILLCALGFAFLWTVHFPFRQLGGENPWLAAALLIVAGSALAVPLLVRAPGHISRLAAVGTVLMLSIGHVKPIFTDNYRVEAFEAVPGEEPQPSHVILIVIDTLRADALSYRNRQALPTPNIDALATESVVFENAISPAPWTFPAMNSLMTGVGPLQESSVFSYPVPPLPTLAEFLKGAGYHTQAIVGNSLLFRPHNVAKGFHDIVTFSTKPTGDTHHSRSLALRFPFVFLHGGTTARLTDQAISWVRDSVSRPSFLWLHYLDPHDEYAPPRAYLPEGVSVAQYPGDRRADPILVKSAYTAEVRFVDHSVGLFLNALKEAGIYEDSLIVLTSDHGEEFWDHGSTGHGQSLYQELLHVPLLIRLPGGGVRKRVRICVPTRALLPTLLDVIGIKSGPQPGWLPSLAPYLQPSEAEGQQYEAPIVSGATRWEEFQRPNPPQHVAEQLPAQMPLRKQQPIISRVLHEPSARLHQPMLQARQRPAFDSLRQPQPPPEITQVGVCT